MIEVRNLVKKYGDFTAVKGISFKADGGKIYGFLGPNGAGKSTTMNIIAGCLAATEGEVLIDGHDIYKEPKEAKKHLGYLPELPPVYTDMTPNEYLTFVGRAKGLKGDKLKKEIARVSEKTGINDVSNKLIKFLSKGYRQRVGLAQAILGSPDVIILDEPTVGLDPKQIIEMRTLIRELGQEHTVFLSSHILSEISETCDYVMIISHGSLVASDTIDNLSRLMSGNVTKLTAVGKEKEITKALEGIPGITQIEVESRGRDSEITYRITSESEIKEKVFYALADIRAPITNITEDVMSLEDIFLKLTDDSAFDTSVYEEEKDDGDDGGEYTPLFTSDKNNKDKTENKTEDGVSDGEKTKDALNEGKDGEVR